MRTLRWWQHALLAALLTPALFAIFTVYQFSLPDPEAFSPQVFFVAAVLLLAGAVRMGRHPLRWVYWLIVAMCLLIFLDEIAYGVELLDFQPIYIERYNFYIRDLHSSIGFLRGVLDEWLPDAGWNPALFATLMRISGVVAHGLLAMWALARHGLQAANEPAWQARILRLTLWASLLTSLATLSFLLWLPGDPKNALVLGLSPTRLAMVAGLAAAAALPAWLLWRPQRWPALQARISAWLGRRALRVAASLLLAAVALAALWYQVNASFTFLPDDLVRLERVMPAVFWAMAQAAWLWLAVQIWSGRLRNPLITMLRDVLQAFRQHPTFIYVAAALLVIFIAQLIDQNYLPLDDMLYTPNYRIQHWAGWTEETLEMIGAFLFAIAAFVMPGKPAGQKSRR